MCRYGAAMDKNNLIEKVKKIFRELEKYDLDDRVSLINKIKKDLLKYSPFKKEPVDCVLWVKSESVYANDYNPNNVAPPEMKLLEHSILCDGYTQPIVTHKKNRKYEVVDGFHRNRVGKESNEVKNRINGYLPVVAIKSDRKERNNRIAATIRHNRARGKHKVDAMSEIVIELKKRNWSPKKIGLELGMDQDEVLRLTQITGLAEMFSSKEFSQAWEAEIMEESEYEGDYETLN